MRSVDPKHIYFFTIFLFFILYRQVFFLLKILGTFTPSINIPTINKIY